MSNKHMEKGLKSLVARGMQIKTTKRYDFPPTKVAIIKKTITTIG